MGILTKMEESLSSKVGALLLAGASFSPFLRTALASEGVSIDSNATISANVAEINTNQEVRRLIRTYGIVQSDSELAQVWTDQQSVYVDKAVIEKGVNPEIFNNLAERINKNFPNWSVYITTPGNLLKEDPSEWQERMKERLNSIVEDQFKDLTRFNINKDTQNGAKNQSVILICYGQGDLPIVLSLAYPGESYVNYGLDPDYWIQYIAPEIGREIAKSGDLDLAVSNAITNFEDALTHRIIAANEEQSAKVLQYREYISNEKREVLSTLEKLNKKLESEISAYDPIVIEKIKDQINLQFDEIERYINQGKLEEAELQLRTIHDIHGVIVSNASDLRSSIEIVDAAKVILEESKKKWFLDEPGLSAINEAEKIVYGISEEVLGLRITNSDTEEKIAKCIEDLSPSINDDQFTEEFTIFSLIISGIAVGALSIECAPKLIDKIKWKIIENRFQRDNTKQKQKSVTSNLLKIGESLREKRNFLNDLYINRDIGEKIEFGSDTPSQSPAINYRQLLLQAGQVLTKLEKIHKDAQALASKKGGCKFDEASELINNKKVPIVDQDELNFLEVVKDWRQATLLGDPHQFSRPSISFKELNKIFAKLTDKAFKSLKMLKVDCS